MAEYPMMTQRAKREITIRDCLTHTTGLTSAMRAPLAFRTQYRDAFEALGWARRKDGESGIAPTFRERVKAMAQSGTTAVLLPGAFYFMRETKVPPIDLLRRYAVPMALSTDCNPGSSPAVSLLLMLNMACTLFRLTPEEALAGVTRNGAGALGLQDQIGTLEQGKDADFVVWDIPEPAELAYRIGANPLRYVVRKGKLVRSSTT